jgi:hypothetical protein
VPGREKFLHGGWEWGAGRSTECPQQTGPGRLGLVGLYHLKEIDIKLMAPIQKVRSGYYGTVARSKLGKRKPLKVFRTST